MIELIEHIDDYWYYGRNADNNDQEGLILAKSMKIVKRLPGEDTVVSGEERRGGGLLTSPSLPLSLVRPGLKRGRVLLPPTTSREVKD